MLKRFPVITGILLFLALTAVTESFVPSLIASVGQEYKPWDRVIAREEVLETDESYDVIALGDSTGVQGMYPAVFEKITGSSMYNFATYADRVGVTDPYMLLRYLEHRSAPKAVIVIRSILSWKEAPNGEYFRQRIPHAKLAKMLFDRGVITPEQYAGSLATVVLPSLHERKTLADMRNIASDSTEQRELQFRKALMPGEKGYEPFQPALHSYRTALNEENLTNLHAIHDENGDAVIDAQQVEALKILCDIGNEHAFPVFVLSGPYDAVVRDDPLLSKAVDDIESHVATALGDYERCAFIPTNHVMAKEYLSDLTHTDNDGAVVFTQMITKEVTDYMNGKAS